MNTLAKQFTVYKGELNFLLILFSEKKAFLKVIPHDSTPRYLKHKTLQPPLKTDTFLTPPVCLEREINTFERGKKTEHMKAEAHIAFKCSSLLHEFKLDFKETVKVNLVW